MEIEVTLKTTVTPEQARRLADVIGRCDTFVLTGDDLASSAYAGAITATFDPPYGLLND